MEREKPDETDAGIADMLLGEPNLRDLANPKKRRHVAKIARMMGIEIRREQLIRIGIAAAIFLVVLAVGLWAIAKVLGLLFWVLIMAGIVVVAVNATGVMRRKPQAEQVSQRGRKADTIRDRKADRQADRALEELERRIGRKP